MTLKKDILLEIGTEELPATHLADIFETDLKSGQGGNRLEARLNKIFEERRLAFETCRVWATSRRLVFWIQKVSERQSPKDQLSKIMLKAEAYSPEGSPSEKFLMILKHRNASVGDTVVSQVGGKDTIFVKKAETVLKTEAALPEALESLVRSLSFPKNMRWDDSGIHFPRPIRSLLCFYGKKVIRFKLGTLLSGNSTRIFSRAKRTIHPVKDIPSYFKLLKKNGVLLDPSERKKKIHSQLKKLASNLKAELYDDPILLSEVNFLVERAEAIAAPFGREFLTLPLEVLIVSMARKQRIFGIVGRDGKLLPKFLAVLDGAPGQKAKKIISANMENILHAKLKDSLFFYKEDTKIPLEKKRDELKNLMFLKGAGSMLEKSDRLVRMAKDLGGDLGLKGPDLATLERAAFLSKCDLLSQMVGEFPELQGVMGKYYALESGEKHETALAVGEQYLPRTVHDHLPETAAGSLLSIFDKADLIAACFRLGLEPTSSLDPYGLRRSATAILKIVLDKKIDLSLDKLLGLGQGKSPDSAEVGLKAFFKDRFKALLVDRGFRDDVVEAAMASSGFEYPCRAFKKVRVLVTLLPEPAFPRAWKVVERTENILKSNKEILPEKIDPSLFTEPLEHRVYENFKKYRQAVLDAAKNKDFALATSLYAEAFFDILGEFFEKVFVNGEDLNVRRNRLALLKAVRDLYTEPIADLSRISLGVK